MTDNALEQYVMQSTDEYARRKLPPCKCFDSDDDECPPSPRLALPDLDEPQLQFALSDDEGSPPRLALPDSDDDDEAPSLPGERL